MTAANAARAVTDSFAHLVARESLQDHCHKAGISCMTVQTGITLPEASGISGSQEIGGYELYLIGPSGGQGSVECGTSVATWSFKPGGGEKKFDGRPQGKNTNTRLTGFFASNSSLKVKTIRLRSCRWLSPGLADLLTLASPRDQTLRGVITSNANGEDLTIECTFF